MSLKSPFFTHLRTQISELGGLYNAHLHLDRSGTYFDINQAEQATSLDYRLSLEKKHQKFSEIHYSDHFQEQHFRNKIETYLDYMIDVGTTRADTLVDVTNDCIGLSNLEVLLECKNNYRGRIDLSLGSYNPLGFSSKNSPEWDLFKQGAVRADFIGSLPERDDKRRYPDKMGFYQHCVNMLELSAELNKPLQIHLDQHNDPSESETELFIKAVNDVGLPLRKTDADCKIFAVHCISPARYDSGRRQDLFSQMAEYGISVICCPSAALSMRQLHCLESPLGNSIAPVLELLSNGVEVRLGSDNIADICSPAGTPDLLDEVFVLCNALRFYDLAILAKLAAGVPLDEQQISDLKSHIEDDNKHVAHSVDYLDPI